MEYIEHFTGDDKKTYKTELSNSGNINNNYHGHHQISHANLCKIGTSHIRFYSTCPWIASTQEGHHLKP